MVMRKIIEIDEDKCTGCSICIPNCQEGALQVIDGKCRLISDLFCDGLGACVGHCPEGAMKVVEREAEEYDEKRVMKENIIPKGEATILAHLSHLKDHGASKYLNEALDYMKEKGIDNPLEKEDKKKSVKACNCPGGKMMDFSDDSDSETDETGKRSSQLRQWPLQLHLVNPNAPYFEKRDVILAADCTAFAIGDFHKDYLKGKSIAIACPKLDSDKEMYIDKLSMMIDDAKINTLTVMIMEVPCCGGLLMIAKEALDKSKRKIPIKSVVISLKGEKISEGWV
ncbi:4Fe-4S binding protein [Candidatus Pacearchaeota archaeon]|nr:4Fe-4S binding protein [Candidatus Pacearchaeota archaeon]